MWILKSGQTSVYNRKEADSVIENKLMVTVVMGKGNVGVVK